MDIISYALSKGNTQKAVTDYLDEHLTNPTNPPIDTSLSIAGAAADSKATGDQIGALKEDFTQISSLGKNLFNKDDVHYINDGTSETGNVYINTGTSKISRNYSQDFTYCGIYIQIEGGKTYTVSKTAGQWFQVGTSVDVPAHGVSLTTCLGYNYNSAITITAGENDTYLSMIVWKSSADALTKEQMLATLQVEEGSTATSYEAYGITAFDRIARKANVALADLSFLGDITKISQNANVDNLTDGVVYSDTGALTNSLTNCPIKNTNCKIITFTRFSTYKIQICIGGNGRLYFRTSSGSSYSAWHEIGNNIEKLDIIPVGGVTPQYGSELCPSLSTFTGTDATWENSAWIVADGGEISTNITVEANKTYLVAFTVTNPYTGADENGVPAYLDVALGNDSVRFFGANDAYWYVALKPTAGGTVTFSVESVNHWTGNITGISIKEVTAFVDYLLSLYSQKARFIYGNNISIGGMEKLSIGDSNTAYGKDAQIGIETARWNTAVGTASQRYLRNGTGNTAVGASAQANIGSGCYNNCVGNATQQAITTGNWNNAFGNEAQLELTEGCNNVNIGRRSGTAMRTGNFNTHIGTWTGFTGINTQEGVDDGRNTISASFQTLIGGKARQIDHQSDGLVAVGYEAQGDENAVAVGRGAVAKGENSIAIGHGVETENNDEVAIGASGQTIILAGKTITFNQDGTVTWTATN